MSVKPQDISSPAGPVVVAVSDIMSENLPVTVETAAASSIAGQVHRAGPVIIVKAVAGAAVRSWFCVVSAKEEF
jgi:hypothetical protein